MENDKRSFYRHPIKVPIQLTEVEAATTTPGRSEDLSQGGLSFFWPHAIPEGTHLQLSIPVERQLFKMQAAVAYCAQDLASGLFKMGVRFLDASSAFRAKLAEEILEIRQYCEKMSLLRGRNFSEEESSRMWIERNAENFSKLLDAS